jgi:hypothetical protein
MIKLDNAPNFRSTLVTSVFSAWNIRVQFVPPRHPQSAGKAESSHIALKRKLLSLLETKGGHWSSLLAEATIRANAKVFNLNHNYDLRLPEFLDNNTNDCSFKDFENFDNFETIKTESENKLKSFLEFEWPEGRRKTCVNVNNKSNTAVDDLSIGDHVRVVNYRTNSLAPYSRGPGIVHSLAPCKRIYGVILNNGAREIQHRENLIKLPLRSEGTAEIPFENFKTDSLHETENQLEPISPKTNSNVWYFWNDGNKKRVGKLQHQVGDQLFLNEYVLDDMHLTPVQMTFSPVHEPVPQVVSVSKSEAQRIPVHATLKVSRAVYRLLTSGGEAAPDLDMCQ